MPARVAENAIQDSARLDALQRLGLLDAPPQEAFDRLTRLVRRLLDAPIALVTLVDRERQFFLSADGLPEPFASRRETPLNQSFCQHVVATGETVKVENATESQLVRESRAVAHIGLVAYIGKPLLTTDGHVLGALCAVDHRPRVWTETEESALADLAALAANEVALRELAAKLEARILNETTARRAAEEDVARNRRLEALGLLAGGVAHDFANVLQAVQAGVRIAAANLERDPAKARRMLDATGDAARRGGAITRRLLGFARRGELRVEHVAAGSVLADLREMLTHTLDLPGLEIGIETDDALPSVLVDRGELEAVLVNLANNARDSMPGGGRLTLSAHPEIIGDEPHASGLPPGRYVRIAVADTGAGMSPDTMARAAEAFFTTKPEGEGTGLGLAMARDFALQTGGGFGLVSELGQGTTVTIWLPAVAEQAAERTGRAA